MPISHSAQPLTVIVWRLWSHLHAVHGLSYLVQMVGRAERLQANIRQLELLLPQFVLQLEDDFRLGFGAFAQPASGITHREEEGGHLGGYTEHTHSHRVLSDKHTFAGNKKAEVQRKAGVSEKNLHRQVQHEGERGTAASGTANPSHLQFSIMFLAKQSEDMLHLRFAQYCAGTTSTKSGSSSILRRTCRIYRSCVVAVQSS